MKPHAGAGHTAPDDIPPVHVLEAAQSQDRKETEDLLAGFDRPGRGPKKAPVERDFVAHYANKKNGAGPDPGRSAPTVPRAAFVPRQIDVDTVIKPRKTQGLPPWLGWAAAVLAMLAIGGAVAFVATDDHPKGKPDTATTITASMGLPPSARDVVPPPAPAEPTMTATTTAVVVEPVVSAPEPVPPPASARPNGRRDPRTAASAAAAAAASAAHASSTNPSPSADRKPPPRDDFIRDL